MNNSVYLFGNLSSGYTQYPDEEFSSEIFQKFHKKAKATTQIAIHRDGRLMYYAYIRKLEQSKYIGLCVVVNDTYITNIEKLFSLFENAISNIAEKGYLIRYNEQGNLVGNTDKLYMKPDEIDIIMDSLKRGFDKQSFSSTKLPAENLALGKDSTKDFTIDDDSKEIISATFNYGYTYIYKSKGYETAQMNSYRGVLSGIAKENNSLKEENNKLKDENAKILRQKKQFQVVFILAIIIALCAFGLLSLNKNLNSTQGQLNEALDSIRSKNIQIQNKNAKINDQTLTIQKQNSKIMNQDTKISEQEKKIQEQNNKIQDYYSTIQSQVNTINQKEKEIKTLNSSKTSLQNSLNNEQKRRQNAEKDIEKLQSSIASLPFIVTSIEIANVDRKDRVINNYGSSIYSSNSMFLKPRIKYIGINSGSSVSVYMKLYTPTGLLSTGKTSPSGFSQSETVRISNGSGNTFYFNGWGGENKGYWSKGQYRIEIWCKSICVGSKTFTIY